MDGKIVDEAIYSLSYVKEFKPIDVGLIERNTNSNGICIINNVDVLIRLIIIDFVTSCLKIRLQVASTSKLSVLGLNLDT